MGCLKSEMTTLTETGRQKLFMRVLYPEGGSQCAYAREINKLEVYYE